MASLISALCDMSFRSASSTISAFASAGSRTSIDVHSIPPRCAITPGYISISARANIGARQDSRDNGSLVRHGGLDGRRGPGADSTRWRPSEAPRDTLGNAHTDLPATVQREATEPAADAQT